MTEIWKPVKDFEGYYEVSNLGRVRSLSRVIVFKDGKQQTKKEYIMTPTVVGGYRAVTLCKDGMHSRQYVHRLVAQTFLPNPDNLPQVNHKDEDKSNNVVTNLEWCTAKYNANYGNRNQKVIETNIKNGRYNPNHTGIGLKELRRRASKEWYDSHPGYWKRFVHK